ncbi:MAG: PHP domain-containing protein [Clostridia bacterium]|nr:PHP domain-containing protein [Clostridia bacterium]
MQYKSELHAHTSEVSKCSRVSTADVVEEYIKKGYHTLVITNHYSSQTFAHMEGSPWAEKNKHYISAYKIAKKAAKGRINVLLAMEYRNCYSPNDYLVYGVTEDFIMKHSCDDEHNFISMHLKDFVNLAHENGMLVFQAHPFRNGMQIINPSYLDGIEILNGHLRHDSRNEIAAMWAKKYDLLECGGSDCHYDGEFATVAMLTYSPIKTNEELIKALKNSPSIVYAEELS